MKPLLAFCALVVGTAPLAHADDIDSAYQANVQSVGVPADSPAAAGPYGRQMCDRLPATGFDPLVAAVNHENPGLTMHQSAMVIGAAVANFCLDKSYLLPHDLKY
ncbi:DUF732 domain-containing protein [Mycobacterium paraterrae]|uniref:DUF732 domain-containing protein n=1 Tax=Mycobacterium paraterrae TaxID=577492 RepID=A0ABY3VPC4_9MYCO|nr:DUF732 domain-containing protein [Mycobacterium paraterrae]UMB68509.1 DUF732 domain-containing protein [Mycobacterium paraterrae]